MEYATDLDGQPSIHVRPALYDSGESADRLRDAVRRRYSASKRAAPETLVGI